MNNMKQLKCPVCNRRLIDSTESTKSELRVEKEMDSCWIPDYIQKCPHCKNQIGIKKVC